MIPHVQTAQNMHGKEGGEALRLLGDPIFQGRKNTFGGVTKTWAFFFLFFSQITILTLDQTPPVYSWRGKICDDRRMYQHGLVGGWNLLFDKIDMS